MNNINMKEFNHAQDKQSLLPNIPFGEAARRWSFKSPLRFIKMYHEVFLGLLGLAGLSIIAYLMYQIF
ncbi:MAG: hypothetical protein GX781_07895 [Clostridiales bacterium]|nr:hypothetical protein [Clostridiales bacterium]